MPIDLCGARTSMTFAHHSWRHVINIALDHKWQPAGIRLRYRQQGDVAKVPVAREADATKELHPMAEVMRSYMGLPDDPVLHGYLCNAGNRVSAKDARALADALERALPDIPRHDALEDKWVVKQGLRLLPDTVKVTPYEWFSGSRRPHLEKFIAFCREGGFRIW